MGIVTSVAVHAEHVRAAAGSVMLEGVDRRLDDAEADRLARASSLALDAGEYADVPDEIVDRLRRVCLGLPETTENPGWAGVQWRIRRRRFAHVLAVDFPAGPVVTLVVAAPGP